MAIFSRKNQDADKQAKSGAGAGVSDVPEAVAGDGQGAAVQFSEENQDKARKWFERAKTVSDARNYDYGIECYISGLELWPEAVEEGHMKLRMVALQRHAAGKKKPSPMERVKHPFGRKDFLRNMLNAEYLWAKDPTNLAYMDAVMKNAVKAGCDRTSMWFGPILFEAALSEKKPSGQRLLQLRSCYVELADRFHENGMYEESCEAFEQAIKALSIAQRIMPNNSTLVDEQRELATRLTIVRGRFDRAHTFKESVRDKEGQADFHDTQRLVQSEQRLDELVAKARKELDAQPKNPSKVMAVVDLLTKREDETSENQAVELLEKAFEESGRQNYRFRMEADHIRMRQFRRARRALQAKLQADRNNRDLQSQFQALIARHAQEELKIFAGRTKAYPTDLGIRFEYGKRLFQNRRFDEAIPILQQCRSDPKNRIECSLYMGRCFLEKGYGDQAVGVLDEAMRAYEIEGDEVSKALHYWLGRAFELEGQADAARKAYGQLMQMDYNYRDVRTRMDELMAKAKQG